MELILSPRVRKCCHWLQPVPRVCVREIKVKAGDYATGVVSLSGVVQLLILAPNTVACWELLMPTSGRPQCFFC